MKNKIDITCKLNISFTNLIGAGLIIYTCVMSALTMSADPWQAPFWAGVTLILGRVVGDKVMTGISDKVNFAAKSKESSKSRE